jgi:hypothetical protein
VYTVKALDAAQAFDFESRAAAKIRDSKMLKIGIVGFGTFGQFLALRMVSQGHSVGAHWNPEIWHPCVRMRVAHCMCRLEASLPCMDSHVCDSCCMSDLLC